MWFGQAGLRRVALSRNLGERAGFSGVSRSVNDLGLYRLVANQPWRWAALAQAQVVVERNLPIVEALAEARAVDLDDARRVACFAKYLVAFKRDPHAVYRHDGTGCDDFAARCGGGPEGDVESLEHVNPFVR